MKNTFKKITALTLSILTVGALASCGKEKPEDISDSQESSSVSSQSENNEKTEITVAFFNAQWSELDDAIRSFNSISDTIKVNIKDYSDGKNLLDMEASEIESIETRMKMDLISGKEFDMVVFDSEDLVLSGSGEFFADLYECMESYAAAKREDFLPNVLASAEIDGRLPALPAIFQVVTSVAKTKHIPEENRDWTVDDVVSVIENMPEGMWFFDQGTTKNAIANYILETSVFDYVDYANNTCSFDSSEFIGLLDTVVNLDIEDGDSDSDGMSLMRDISLISQRFLCQLNNSAIFSFFSDNGENMSFLGYPTKDGGKSYPDTEEFISICETSDKKEEAWEVISYVLTESYIIKDMCERGLGFPVGTKHFRSFMDAEGKETINGEVPLFWADGQIVSLTDEQIAYYEEYILGTEGTFYIDRNINNIIWEETQVLFGGEATPEECARIIQNRVTIYLSERS